MVDRLPSSEDADQTGQVENIHCCPYYKEIFLQYDWTVGECHYTLTSEGMRHCGNLCKSGLQAHWAQAPNSTAETSELLGIRGTASRA